MVAIIFLFIQVAVAIFFLFLSLAFLTGAPFVPSTNTVAKSMIDLSRIKRGAVIYDLGSGDGRLLFLAAQKGAKQAVGLEINPYLALYANLRAFFSPWHHIVTSRWRNFWNVNLEAADIVYIYLLPWRMDKLGAKLKRELKPGALVVSNSFIFPGWKIVRQNEHEHVYVFEV